MTLRRLLVASLMLAPMLALGDTVIAPLNGAKNQEWVVTNAAGGSTLTSFSLRRSILIQNLGPNPIYCTLDGQAPTVALGTQVPESGGTYTIPASDSLTIKCIAASAAQVAGAATQVIELQ